MRSAPGIAVVGVVTVLLGLAYRFGHGLTVDEPYMANMVRLPWRQVWDVFPIDNVPFAYVVLKIWTAVLGESELALRSLSAVFYGAAVMLVGLAGGRIAGSGVAIAAAVFLAASDRIGLEHAATARPYALLCCVTAAALLQSVRALKDESIQPGGGWRRVILPATTHVVGLLSHPAYVVIATACAVAGATASERRLRSVVFLAPAIAMATYFIVWGRVIAETIALQTTSWMMPPTAYGVQHAFQLLWGVGSGFVLAGAMLTLVLLKGREARHAWREAPVKWVITVAVIAWVLAVGVSIWKPIFEPTRTPVMLLPPTCLAAAVLLARLGGDRVAVGIALFCVAAAAQRVGLLPRQDPYATREGVASVLSRMQCGDTLVAPGHAPQLVEYYLRRLHAPECVAMVPFPRTLMNWEGRMLDPDFLTNLESEATALAFDHATRPSATWLLTLSRGQAVEASTTMEAAVRKRMACEPSEPLNGPSFDRVARCVPRDPPPWQP